MKTIIITGANGFIGSELLKQFAINNDKTIAWVRNPSTFTGNASEIETYDINQPETANWPVKADAFIHCAWMFINQSKDAEELNFRAVQYLSQQCRQRDIHFIFISSLSANTHSRSNYGKSKFQCESMLMKTGTLIIKPGLVIGNGGLFKRISSLIQKLPLIPLPVGGKAILQTIYVKDLCQVMDEMIEKRSKDIVILAHHRAISLRDFYHMIAKHTGKNPFFFPIPLNGILLILRMANMIFPSVPVTSDSLTGLKYSNYYDTQILSRQYHLLSTEESLREMLPEK